MKKIKTITMYLPQFHRVPENDMWWGEGYTDWVAVRAAKPLYEGHLQPRVPLNHNYYDLLNKSTMMWQADLMHQYGIDGQCFYHYYFKEGRKILERPAENLLQWKDINMPFCFCWDSGNWTRTWSNVKGNSWADVFEEKDKDGGTGVLLKQKFGGRDAWLKHFEYLFPFFSDERYIKVNGAPVFIIYGPASIYCLEEMMEYWKLLIRQRGFPDIYVIGANVKDKVLGLDAILLHSPHMFMRLQRDDTREGMTVFDYEETWDKIIKAPPSDRCRTYYEGIIDYDDTGRRGKRGVVLRNFSIDKFQKYLCLLYKKSISLGNEFVFINAWNEWGEGMYLEPDTKNGYGCLEAVKCAQIEAERSKDDGGVSYSDCAKDTLETISNKYERNRRLLNCLKKLMSLQDEKKNLGEHLFRLGVNTIAIYGAGILGRCLLSELKGSIIKVDYFIDKKPMVQVAGYRVISSCEELEEVDAIVVAVAGEASAICDALRNKTNAMLMGLEELLYEEV